MKCRQKESGMIQERRDAGVVASKWTPKRVQTRHADDCPPDRKKREGLPKISHVRKKERRIYQIPG